MVQLWAYDINDRWNPSLDDFLVKRHPPVLFIEDDNPMFYLQADVE